MSRGPSRTIILGLLLVAIAGCKRGPRLAEVEGVVKQNGKPLANVQVEFWPEVEGPRSFGATDANGHYVLTTDDGKQAGAVVGSHRVVLYDLSVYANLPINNARAMENVRLKPVRFSGRYTDPQQTPLKKTVDAGTRNNIDLEVLP
jgi:hypothetical protein